MRAKRKPAKRAKKRQSPKFVCLCGWKGSRPIMAECPTCPWCGDGVYRA